MLQHNTRGPVLVVSPHYDDAVLDCWSLLTDDRSVVVVNAYGGEPADGYATWWDRSCGASNSLQMVRARRAEDERALELAGHRPIDLDLLPEQYRLRPNRLLHGLLLRVPALRWRLPRAPILRRWAWTAVAPSPAEVLGRLAEAVPAACRLCVPAGIGAHPDHLAVRAAALEAASRGMPVRLYADLPYGVRYGWPSWVSGERADDTKVVAHWEPALVPLGLDPRAGTVVRLDEAQAAAKAIAVRTYATQYASMDSGVQGRLKEPATYRYEVFWDLLAR